MMVLDVLKSAVGADVLVTSFVFRHVLELQLEPGTAFPEEEETKVQSVPLTQSFAPCSLAFAHSEAVKKLWLLPQVAHTRLHCGSVASFGGGDGGVSSCGGSEGGGEGGGGVGGAGGEGEGGGGEGGGEGGGGEGGGEGAGADGGGDGGGGEGARPRVVGCRSCLLGVALREQQRARPRFTFSTRGGVRRWKMRIEKISASVRGCFCEGQRPRLRVRHTPCVHSQRSPAGIREGLRSVAEPVGRSPNRHE